MQRNAPVGGRTSARPCGIYGGGDGDEDLSIVGGHQEQLLLLGHLLEQV